MLPICLVNRSNPVVGSCSKTDAETPMINTILILFHFFLLKKMCVFFPHARLQVVAAEVTVLQLLH